MTISIDEREATVARVIELLAELQRTNGDSPDRGHLERERLRNQLHRLAIWLWRDGRSKQ